MKPSREKIIFTLYRAKNHKATFSRLQKLGRSSKHADMWLRARLTELKNTGIITEEDGVYSLAMKKRLFEGVVSRVFRTHGSVRCLKTGEEFFVPGRRLLAAVPGDIVLARRILGERDEGQQELCEILLILEESAGALVGTIVRGRGNGAVYGEIRGGRSAVRGKGRGRADGAVYGEIRGGRSRENGGRAPLMLRPETFVADPLMIADFGGQAVQEGDKVRFALNKRGKRHSDHVVDIVSVYGSAESAAVAVEAYLEEKEIPGDFPDEVVTEAQHIQQKGITKAEKNKRLDLREEIIFTIDGADTKDIDDAVSIARTESGWRVGVHIADVSHYVKLRSALDKEAMERGTSVYIADLVVPMLPKELSNGICSLNPGKDRLALSCLMEVDFSGELGEFSFEKTLICSRVQGVYSEINEGLMAGTFPPKYAEVGESLALMRELAGVLRENRARRGAPVIETRETKVVCDESGAPVEISARQGGESEQMIEEFMLLANNAAARLAMREEMPFVYRIHEEPTAEKLSSLAETLTAMGYHDHGINENSGAPDLARVIAAAKGTEKYGTVTMQVLRAMMKAKYSPKPVGHFGLMMPEYAHFTSPIRRYSDLAVHRIISAFIAGGAWKKYTHFAGKAAVQASVTELRAVSAERDCVKFYMAEYMKKHVGETFDGVISGVSSSGLFVQLENTVEGRVDVYTLPPGEYVRQDFLTLTETVSGARYEAGTAVRVECVGASVAAGLIDFVIVSPRN